MSQFKRWGEYALLVSGLAVVVFVVAHPSGRWQAIASAAWAIVGAVWLGIAQGVATFDRRMDRQRVADTRTNIVNVIEAIRADRPYRLMRSLKSDGTVFNTQGEAVYR